MKNDETTETEDRAKAGEQREEGSPLNGMSDFSR